MPSLRAEEPLLCPALVSADPLSFRHVLDELVEARAPMLHLDVMDGSFAPHLSYGPVICNRVAEYYPLPVEVHVATQHPMDIVERLDAERYRFISLHAEAISAEQLRRVAGTLSPQRVGVALRGESPVEALLPFLEHVRKVLILTSDPRTGVPDPAATSRVEAVANLLRAQGLEQSHTIQVDGGVNASTIRGLFAAGAHEFVVGSSLFLPKTTLAETLHQLVARAVQP